MGKLIYDPIKKLFIDEAIESRSDTEDEQSSGDSVDDSDASDVSDESEDEDYSRKDKKRARKAYSTGAANEGPDDHSEIVIDCLKSIDNTLKEIKAVIDAQALIIAKAAEPEKKKKNKYMKALDKNLSSSTETSGKCTKGIKDQEGIRWCTGSCGQLAQHEYTK